MSQLQHCLDILGFTNVQDMTADSLKKAFKVTVLRAHPDKGGDQNAFDELLSAYLYLLETVNDKLTLRGLPEVSIKTLEADINAINQGDFPEADASLPPLNGGRLYDLRYDHVDRMYR